MENNLKTYVTIATYNERDTVRDLISKIFALEIGRLGVIVIDDNSPDGTGDIVEKLKKDYQNLVLIKREKKEGYGSAHLRGFAHALNQGADIIISMDADLSHDPAIIKQFVKIIPDGYDVVIGSRRIPRGKIIGWNAWRHFASAGAMMVARLVLGIKTKDVTSGFRAYRADALVKINFNNIKSDGYAFLEEILFILEKGNNRIKEIPIIFRDRRLGKSKLSKKEILKFFKTIFVLKWKMIFRP